MAVKHGFRPSGDMSPTYRSWVSMKQRCGNPLATGYEHYGGRGIKVCERWASDFTEFMLDMGERPEGKSIERINTDGDYEPSNCKWATPTEQARNRRNTVIIEVDGVDRLACEVAEESGIPLGKILRRLSEGKALEDVLSKNHLLHNRWGDKSPASILRESDVVEIKERLFKGETCASVARDFKRSYMCIKDIHKGKNWKNVPWPK